MCCLVVRPSERLVIPGVPNLFWDILKEQNEARQEALCRPDKEHREKQYNQLKPCRPVGVRSGDA